MWPCSRRHEPAQAFALVSSLAQGRYSFKKQLIYSQKVKYVKPYEPRVKGYFVRTGSAVEHIPKQEP